MSGIPGEMVGAGLPDSANYGPRGLPLTQVPGPANRLHAPILSASQPSLWRFCQERPASRMAPRTCGILTNQSVPSPNDFDLIVPKTVASAGRQMPSLRFHGELSRP